MAPSSEVDSGRRQGHQQQGFQWSDRASLCWVCLGGSDLEGSVPAQETVFSTEAENGSRGHLSCCTQFKTDFWFPWNRT